NDIYRTARSSAGFGGEPVIDHLKLLYGFGRQFRTGGACKLVVIFNAVNVETIAARAQTSEGESAISKGALAAGSSLNIRPRQLRSQEHEVEVIAADHGRLLNPVMVDCGCFGGLGRVNPWRLLRHSDLLLNRRGIELNCHLNDPP